MNKWRLTGTPTQIALAQSALDDIKFPWDQLDITWMPELGWRDLNSGNFLANNPPVSDEGHGVIGKVGRAVSSVLAAATGHDHDHYTPENEGPPEPLNGRLEGREFTYAVFYPGSGRIYIDHRLGKYPALARASVSAEVAHAVDEFWPLTEDMRNRIIRTIDPQNRHNLSWWERYNYSAEYWSLAGEMFMPIFTDTFSDIPFGDVSSFIVNPRNCDPQELIAIMGINRTDYVPTPPAPPPPPPPPEPVIEPDEEIIPVPAPVPEPTPEPAPAPETHLHKYHNFPPSKIVHKPSHYDHRASAGVYLEAEHIPEGYRACKVCKPH